MKRHRVGPIAALVVLACGSFSRAAYASDPAGAREQLKAGYLLAQDGNCEAAIPRFVESLKLDPKAITLINLANCEEKTEKLADALGHWVEARERAQSEGNSAIVEEAEKRARALEPKLSRLTIALAKSAPKGAEVSRDGVVLGAVSLGVSLPVNAGAHTVVVRAKGYEDSTTNVELSSGETKDVVVDVGAKKPEAEGAGITTSAGEEAPKPGKHSATSPLVYAGFGTAIVGVGIGAVTGLLAMNKASEVSAACPDHACTNASALGEVDTGRTLGTVSTVAFIVGGVGAALGVVGLLTGGKETEAGSVAISVGPMGGSLRGRF